MSKDFIKAALIRAVRTIAQTAIATIGTTAVIEQVRWLTVLSASALAGLLSLLTSIATGLPEVATSSVNKQTDKPPDEESCPVTVKAYDDYYENGSPKVKDGVLLPESIDEDGGADDPD